MKMSARAAQKTQPKNTPQKNKKRKNTFFSFQNYRTTNSIQNCKYISFY